MTTQPETFAEWLQRARRARDLTQTDLAGLVGCSTALISKLERGERRPSRQIVLLLAAHLGVPEEQRAALASFARAEAQPPPVPLASTPAPPEDAPAFAPPAASAPALRPLPAAPPLVGREAELAQLGALLADPAARLITLAGPGGVGKSHLALAFAQRAGLPDGACFVSLAAVGSPDGAAAALATALGLELAGAADPLDLAVAALRERRALLVLDNLEQLLGATAGGADLVAELMDALLAGCPGLRLLVTSRERLNLRAEWVVELAGLPPPPAERLFLAAMRRQQPQAALSADDQAAVRNICGLLGGLPLAIELAATWTATLSCREIARELARSLDLLNGRLRDAPARHRSMRAVFDQSWQLLPPEERAALARLAIFHAGFNREAAAFIARAGLPELGGLLQRSLLRRAGERYELHPVIRHYSREQLGADAAHAATRQRYLDYYLAYAVAAEEALSGPEQLRWLDDVAGELDNLRAALRLALAEPGRREAGARICAALRRFWVLRGPFREGLAWADRLLAAGSLPAELRAGLLIVVSVLASPLGDARRAIAAAEEAVALRREGGAPAELAAALRVLASVEGADGRREQAEAHLEEALALWQGHGDRHETVVTLGALAQLAWDRADHAEAQRLYSAAAAAARVGGYRVELAALLVNAGLIALFLGRPEGAADCAEALAEFAATGERLGVAYALEALAAYAGMCGDHEAGGVLFGAAAALRERIEAPAEPSHRPILAQFRRAAQGDLPTPAFASAVARGRALPEEAAAALAQELAARRPGSAVQDW